MFLSDLELLFHLITDYLWKVFLQWFFIWVHYQISQRNLNPQRFQCNWLRMESHLFGVVQSFRGQFSVAHLRMTLQKQGTLEMMQAEFGLCRSCVADGSFGRQEAWLGLVWPATLDSKEMLREQRNSHLSLLAILIYLAWHLLVCQSFPWIIWIHSGSPFIDSQGFSCGLYSTFKVLPWPGFMPLLPCLKGVCLGIQLGIKSPSFFRDQGQEFSGAGFNSRFFLLLQL